MELEHTIALYRNLFNYTQSELAAKAGVSTSTIMKMETNQVIPKISTVYKIAEIFEIPVQEVYFKVGERPMIRIPKHLQGDCTRDKS